MGKEFLCIAWPASLPPSLLLFFCFLSFGELWGFLAAGDGHRSQVGFLLNFSTTGLEPIQIVNL